MKQKKLTHFFLGLSVLALSLSGCSGSQEASSSEDDPRYQIYVLALKDGYTGTYEEWLASIAGKDGKDGKDGHTPVITIGSDGYWYIDGVNTHVSARGDQGPKGDQGEKGEDGSKGADGEKGADGSALLTGSGAPTADKGKDGDSYIDTDTWDYYSKVNGAWVKQGNIKGEQGSQGDAGSQGPKGDPGEKGETGASGVSVLKIEKTSTEGLVDTYTITYSDQSTSTFLVTNGAQGIQGIQGVKGEDGHSPVVTIDADGYWVVDGVPTTTLAKGPKGDQGEQGPQGEKGDNGVSIVSIAKTGTSGLVDTYTITYSDRSTSTFTVTNGEQGIQGIQGEQGETGVSITSIEKLGSQNNVDTYRIHFSDGEHFDFVVTNGTNGSQGIQGEQGETGKSAYELALENGYEGTLQEWLDSLIGENGNNGASAYELAVAKGYEGSLSQWLESLVGPQGIQGEQGETGKSAYELAVQNGYEGTLEEWLLSLVGATGAQGQQGVAGKSAYELAVENGFEGTLSEWLASLVGATGAQGAQGEQGPQGEKGEDGVSVVSIAKTGTSGLVDTYTITYSDDSTSTFTVTNGEQGIQGEQGEQGETGVSITGTHIDENGDLIVEFSNGQEANAGHVKDVDTYRVRFYLDGELIDTKVVGKGNIVSRPASLPEGYNVTDWYIVDNGNHESWKFFTYAVYSDIDLYADFAYDTYHISFVDEAFDHQVNDLEVTYKGNYELPALEQEGYTFLSWKNDDEVFASSGVYNIASDLVLTASWNEGNAYQVTLNPSGGEVPSDAVNVQYDHAYELPTPTRTGYSFAGWYDGDDLVNSTGTWRFASNKALTARWTIDNYAIQYVLNGGTNNANNPASYTVESAVTYLNPTRDYYNFAGWYSDSGFKTPSEGIALGSTGDKAVYAKWTPVSYDITYHLDGGTNNPNNPATYNVEDELTFGAPTKTGYEFQGWYTDQSFEHPVTGIELGSHVNMDLYAKWNVVNYDITYELSGGINNPNNPNSFTVEDEVTLASASLLGHGFLGWYDEQENLVEAIDGQYARDLTLTARFDDGALYGLTLNPGEGSIASTECQVQYGHEYELPTPTAPSGYRFAGWYYGDVYVPSTGTWNTVCEPGTTLTAKYYSSYLSFSGNTLSRCSSEASGEIFIPEVVNGYTITNIDAYAFSSCSNVTSVTMPDTITTVGTYAFNGCYRLESVELSANLTAIPANMFDNCSALTSIVIPEGVVSIGEHAFHYCSHLDSITLPSTLASIGACSYPGATNVTSITYHGSTANWVALTNLDALGTRSNNCSLHLYLDGSEEEATAIVVPEGVTSLSGNFAKCKTITSVTLPSTLTTIGDNTFDGCENLETINFPASLQSIGNRAFYGCTSLGYEIDLSSTSVTSLGQYAFYGCSVITDVTLPTEMTTIDMGAFQSCISLENLVMPESLETLGSQSFAYCSSLKSFAVPNGITTLPSGVLYSSNAVTRLDLPSSLQTINNLGLLFNDPVQVYYYGSLEGWLNLAGKQQFANTSFHLYLDGTDVETTEIVLPNTMTAIPDYAFYYCNSITSVVIPDSVTSIGEKAFYYCNHLADISLPHTITHIGSQAFYSISYSATVDISDNVVDLGDIGFGMSNGTAFGTPSETRINYFGTIDSWLAIYNKLEVFSRNTHLYLDGTDVETTEIVLPDTATVLRAYEFAYCPSLTSVILPETVEYVDLNAFVGSGSVYNTYSCNRYIGTASNPYLYCIESYASTYNGISYIHEDCQYMPGSSYYTTWWSTPALQYNEYENGKYIGTETNPYAWLLGVSDKTCTSFTFHEDCVGVAGGAFSGCSKLESIVLPNGIKSIGSQTFGNCSALTSVTIPSSVVSIYSWAFYNCNALTEVTIPEGVKYIDDAFAFCSALASISFPDSTEMIIGRAAVSCSALVCYESNGGYYLGNEGSQCMVFCRPKVAGAKTVTIDDSCRFIASVNPASSYSLTTLNIGTNVAAILSNALSGYDSLSTIEYAGTVAQWNAIVKEQSWKKTGKTITINCSDGSLTVN